MANIKNILKNDYAFSVISRGINVFFFVIYIVLFNRFFGVELRGESAVILNYITVVSTVLDFGITQSYAYFRSKKENVMVVFFANATGAFILMMIVCMLMVILLTSKSWNAVLLILPIRVYTNRINTMLSIENPSKRNQVLILQNIIDILSIAILLFAFSPSYKLLAAFLIFKEIAALVLILQYLEVKFGIKYIDFNFICQSIRFGFFSMICVFLMEINYRVDVIMLDGKIEVAMIGIYSLGVSLSERVWLIPDALRDILVSKLSKGYNYKEVAKISRFSFWTCLIMIIIVSVFGEYAIILLFGVEYQGSYQITLVLLIGVLGMVYYKMIYAYFLVRGKQRINIMILFITAITNVVGNYILIPTKGIMGAAIASVISYLACGCLFAIAFVCETGLPIKDLLLLKKDDFKGRVFD